MVILWLQKKHEQCVIATILCVFATRSYLWLQHDYVCVVKTTWLFWLFMIASMNSVWLQQQVHCDCKKPWIVCLCNYFVCVIANIVMVILWLQKKDWTVCVCNYVVCAWLQPEAIYGCNMTVCVVKTTWLFGYLWLQAWVVCDCNSRFVVIANKSMHSVFENYFVCDCKHCWLFYDCKKKPEQCAFATILRVWLQPEVICACNMTVSMWLKLFGYLVIYDCKPK
jgi:hypothetical protein